VAARKDDATSEASCPAGYTLTGCSCHSFWNSCDGARIENGKCKAYSNWRARGVYAYATCGRLGATNMQNHHGPKSGNWDDAPSKVTCPSGTSLTGCTCYSPYDNCDGAAFVGNTCIAFNSWRGPGVYAQARCGVIPGASGWTQVMSGRSGRNDDAQAKASCPAGKTLTGCTCYSPWHACDGAQPSGNTCVAFNKGGGAGVYAYARCASI